VRVLLHDASILLLNVPDNDRLRDINTTSGEEIVLLKR
jgi:hypothetical protein